MPKRQKKPLAHFGPLASNASQSQVSKEFPSARIDFRISQRDGVIAGDQLDGT